LTPKDWEREWFIKDLRRRGSVGENKWREREREDSDKG
jgi:hypothetical protein